MIRIQIFCDSCGRGGTHNDGGHTKPHLLRGELRMKGWKTGLPGGEDRCPECARQAAVKIKKTTKKHRDIARSMGVWEFMEKYAGTGIRKYDGYCARVLVNSLWDQDVNIGDLIDMGYAALYKRRRIGKETLHRFRLALAKAGLELKP